MEIIAELVRSRLTEELVPVNERDEIMEPLANPARFNRVQIITGMRRSGKTLYLFPQMHKLIERGVPRRHIFYFDFSDDRLPSADRLMDEVLDEYWRAGSERAHRGRLPVPRRGAGLRGVARHLQKGCRDRGGHPHDHGLVIKGVFR